MPDPLPDPLLPRRLQKLALLVLAFAAPARAAIVNDAPFTDAPAQAWSSTTPTAVAIGPRTYATAAHVGGTVRDPVLDFAIYQTAMDAPTFAWPGMLDLTQPVIYVGDGRTNGTRITSFPPGWTSVPGPMQSYTFSPDDAATKSALINGYLHVGYPDLTRSFALQPDDSGSALLQIQAGVLRAVGIGEGLLVGPYTGANEIRRGDQSLFVTIPSWVSNYLPALGDANYDGIVGYTDLLALARNYNRPGTWSNGDFTGDGVVNFSDLLVLAKNYPTHSDVPEPAVLPVVVLLLRRWR